MANYNAVMNQKISNSMTNLAEEILWADNKAFFGSVLGTLNHLMVGDLIWLRRFNPLSSHPHGFDALRQLVDFPISTALTQTLYYQKKGFISNRQKLDHIIIDFIQEIDDSDYAKILSYTNTENIAHQKPFSMLLQHFFNHQTHHRGQVTTLLNQVGIDIGETDLLMIIDDIN